MQTPWSNTLQNVGAQGARQFHAGVVNRRLPAAVGGLQQQFGRLAPMRIGLGLVSEREHDVARLRERRDGAAIVEMEGFGQPARPRHALEPLAIEKTLG